MIKKQRGDVDAPGKRKTTKCGVELTSLAITVCRLVKDLYNLWGNFGIAQ
jgi:hypothetical protein